MAKAGGLTVDGGDMMPYAEYTSKTNVKSDAEIDRRLVSDRFHTWRPLWSHWRDVTLRYLYDRLRNGGATAG